MNIRSSWTNHSTCSQWDTVEVLDRTVSECALQSSYHLHIVEVDYCTLCPCPVFLDHRWCYTPTIETTHSSCHELYS